MSYWFVMTLGEELEAGEAVKGLALCPRTLPTYGTSCGSDSSCMEDISLPLSPEEARLLCSDLATVSHVVCAALDFVLSFQVRHIASIFSIDDCDYTSYMHKLAIAALLSGATGERREAAGSSCPPRGRSPRALGPGALFAGWSWLGNGEQ